MRFVPLAYLALCVVALAIFAAGSPALAGANADPLSAVFAYLLSLPWVLALDLVGEVPMAVSLAFMLAGMAINFLILRALVRRRDKTITTVTSEGEEA